ncbi:MAG: T9SS type A sorting domain-containing protein [Bacteroidota bacterium]
MQVKFTLLALTILMAGSLYAQFPCISGEIGLAPGNEASLCNNNGDNIIRFQSEPQGVPRAYVVVDANDVIVSIGYASSIDFSGLTGPLYVYGFTLIGSITAEVGDILGEVDLASGCFELSGNSIEISTNGGQDGGTLVGGPLTFCVNNGYDDFIFDGAIDRTDGQGSTQQWLVTSEEGEILGLPDDYTDVNFDNTGFGRCFIYNLSYDEAPGGLAIGTNIADLTGCYGISNRVVVRRRDPTGGTLVGGPFTFCVGDGIPDFILEDEIDVIGQRGSRRAWIVTDADGTILGLPNFYYDVDFDGAGAGNCLVYFMRYEAGLRNLEVGANVDDFIGCFGLSNPITVERIALDAGTVATASGESDIEVTVGDGIDDNVEFVSTGSSGGDFALLITNELNEIVTISTDLTINFEGAGPGECRVWGLTYSGNIIAEAGDNATQVDISDECALLTETFVRVNRTEGFGTQVPTANYGVESPVNLELRLFPNPVQDQLSIRLMNTVEGATNLQLLNLNGQLIQQYSFSGAFQQSTLDLSALPTGTYFLRAFNGAEVVTERFVKQ